MNYVTLGFSFFMAAMGGLGIASPARLFDVVRHVQTPVGLYAVATLRVFLGTALFLAAPASRAPDVLHFLGVIAFAAGVITPFFGLVRFGQLLDWWSAQNAMFIRAWAVLPITLGLFLAWAVVF